MHRLLRHSFSRIRILFITLSMTPLAVHATPLPHHAAVSAGTTPRDPFSCVNPFIGTARGGNTFPGALLPWGMVSVSPHTDLTSPSGYNHDQPWFYGMGHVHLSGTGCSDLGSIVVTAVRGKVHTSPEGYRTRKGEEDAAPGWYSVVLPDLALTFESTATTRSGITRIRSTRGGEITILIDAGRSLGLTGGGSVVVHDPSRSDGYNTGGGFCGEDNRHTVHFSAMLSKPAIAAGVWTDTTLQGNGPVTASSQPVGAWFRLHLDRGESVEVRVGISYVSIANARANRTTESDGISFDTLRSHARAAWQHALSRVHIPAGPDTSLTIFYTALYHTLIHPGIISDCNGEFPLMGHTGTGRYDRRDRYSVFSLWDTYRTLHPMLALLYPEQQESIVRTMLDMSDESGWLPKWELAGNETHMMVGESAVQVIADSYLKGVGGDDARRVWKALTRGAETMADSVRPGYAEALTYGYIPLDQDTMKTWWTWGPVSSFLEYCLADWTISAVARQMGLHAEEIDYRARSLRYRTLYDNATRFLRPRLRNGAWACPFDPQAMEGSGNWTGSGGPGYVEGNAWHYTWFVPHDITGLASFFGSTDSFLTKLDSCFSEKIFTINNEPDIAYPYIYTYFPGREAKTRAIVHDICLNEFGTGPDGLPGNDDAGSISAWYVFSALGIYPACPGSNEYRIGFPLFKEIKVTIPVADPATPPVIVKIVAASGTNAGAAGPRWNGKSLHTYAISHENLREGGVLEFPREWFPP